MPVDKPVLWDCALFSCIFEILELAYRIIDKLHLQFKIINMISCCQIRIRNQEDMHTCYTSIFLTICNYF